MLMWRELAKLAWGLSQHLGNAQCQVPVLSSTEVSHTSDTPDQNKGDTGGVNWSSPTGALGGSHCSPTMAEALLISSAMEDASTTI